MPVAVALFSALVNLPEGTKVELYILDGGISDVNRDRIERVLNVPTVESSLHWLEPSGARFMHLKTPMHWSHAAYNRLALPELIPERHAKVVYLDADLVVFGNLTELWEQRLDDRPLLAVRDYYQHYVSSPSSPLLETYRTLGLAPDTPYFNSGVMVLNLALMRSTDSIDRVLAYLATASDSVKSVDQHGLNAVFSPNWGQLDLRWNVQAYAVRFAKRLPPSTLADEIRRRRRTLGRDAAILHFPMTPKPWQGGFPNRYRVRWIHCLWRSGWFSRWEFGQWLVRWVGNAFAHAWSVALRRARHMLRWSVA